MINAPRTLEEARAYPYGMWAGNPGGTTYDPNDCAMEITDSVHWHWRQCSRKPGHGPGKLYCWQHARRFSEGQG